VPDVMVVKTVPDVMVVVERGGAETPIMTCPGVVPTWGMVDVNPGAPGAREVVMKLVVCVIVDTPMITIPETVDVNSEVPDSVVVAVICVYVVVINAVDVVVKEEVVVTVVEEVTVEVETTVLVEVTGATVCVTPKYILVTVVCAVTVFPFVVVIVMKDVAVTIGVFPVDVTVEVRKHARSRV